LVVREEARIAGGIVLTRNVKNRFGNPLLCKYLGVYFGAFSGSEYNQETKRRKIIQALLIELEKLPDFDYYFHPQFSSFFPFDPKFENRVRYSYWMRLKDQSADNIQHQFHAKLRSELKFADSQEYELVKNLDFDMFFRICQDSFQQKGNAFPFTHSFLKHYTAHLVKRKALQLYGVKDKAGIIMAVAGILQDQATSTLILSGHNSEKIKRGANEWLIYQCIQQALKTSDYFDFEGSMIPEIESFYRKFGGTFVPYLNVYKNTTRRFFTNRLRSFFKK